MIEITDEVIINDAWIAFQLEVNKLPRVGSGIFTSALHAALNEVRKKHPQIVKLDIVSEGDERIFKVYG